MTIRGCRALVFAAGLVASSLSGCRKSALEHKATASSASASVSAVPRAKGSIGPPEPSPPPRTGMVWIPGGALVAGTPASELPRRADQEMLGEQVILHGYYVDSFPYPNEEGAIPLTNVTQEEALRLCVERGKRLCTELEWERACKGPNNRPYEYGDRHRPDRCATGVEPNLRPSGLRVGCRSDFAVRDMHGGAFEWTSSRFGRGTSGALVAVRGGNGTTGEVVARCANAESRAPDIKSGVVGFRCCAGDVNEAEVNLEVRSGKSLEEHERVERQRSSRLIAALPEEAQRALARGGPTPRVERLWTWRPVGNENLTVAAICTGLGTRPVCGVLVARDELGKATGLGWGASGLFIASAHIMDREPRDLWVLGGDEAGRFKRLIGYAWGRVSVHAEDRRVGKEPAKKKKKKD